MNLHEYQAREILARYGIPTTLGGLATTPEEARQVAEQIGGRVVVKAQVLVGGRGKAGGIKLANNPDEAAAVASRILGMQIKGVPVQKVLVAEAVEIAREIYLGITIDRAAGAVTVMASAEGGVEIEDVARTAPEKIVKVAASPGLGLLDYQAREVAFRLGLEPAQVKQLVPLIRGLYNALVATDASLAEVNPLAITPSGELSAVDTKIVLDDNSLFRHPDLAELRDVGAEDPFERQARELGISYVRLDGDIGCIVNGAGLAMATMDVIKLYGGSPANFLDIGGGARADRVAAALRLILSAPGVDGVLFNIFGGITRCDEVARGIVAAREAVKVTVPMVVRLVGTNEAEGRQILKEAGLVAVTSMDEAARAVVAAVGQARAAVGQAGAQAGGTR